MEREPENNNLHWIICFKTKPLETLCLKIQASANVQKPHGMCPVKSVFFFF